MDLQWHFFEEVVDIQTILPDNVNNQLVLHWLLGVKFQRGDDALRQAEALEWIKAILRLRNIIDNHNGVREFLERVDKVVQVLRREGKSLLAAHVETDVELAVLLVFALRSNLDMRLRNFEIDFVYLGLLLDVAEYISHDAIPCLAVDR